MPRPPSDLSESPPARPLRIGCVSFINAKPLIAPIAGSPDCQITYAVPSALLDMLESSAVDVALCPVIDFQKSKSPLTLLPVGGIGCDGPTLTVRLYSSIPIAQITTIHADTDSHTSVNLLRILMHHVYHISPEIVSFDARENLAKNQNDKPTAMLLIGDKVVVPPLP